MAQEMIDQRYEVDKIRALSGGFSRWLDLEYDTE
jgi:hypothetical protein